MSTSAQTLRMRFRRTTALVLGLNVGAGTVLLWSQLQDQYTHGWPPAIALACLTAILAGGLLAWRLSSTWLRLKQWWKALLLLCCWLALVCCAAGLSYWLGERALDPRLSFGDTPALHDFLSIILYPATFLAFASPVWLLSLPPTLWWLERQRRRVRVLQGTSQNRREWVEDKAQRAQEPQCTWGT